MMSLGKLIVYAMLGMPWMAMGLSISGSVTGGTGQGVRIPLAIPTTLDTLYAGFTIFGNSYLIPDVPAGRYIVAAFEDTNSTFFPDSGEAYGMYGGSYPEFVEIPPSAIGINISLTSPQAAGQFTGTVSYTGLQRGPCLIMATRDAAFLMEPRGAGFVFGDSADGEIFETDGNGIFGAVTDSLGQMYAIAFMDLDGDLVPDLTEPRGAYGGESPTPFTLLQGDTLSGIDMVMLDPPSRITDLTIVRSGNDIWLNWTPPVDSVVEYWIWQSPFPNVEPTDANFVATTTINSYQHVNAIPNGPAYARYTVTCVFAPDSAR